MSGSLWRAMDRPTMGFGSDGEQIARATALQVIQNLEPQCELQDTLWTARDEDWAKAIGIVYQQTRINRVPKGSIYLGAQPSLVAGESARFDKWPAVTIRCGQFGPTDDQGQPDQFDSLDVVLVVEVLATAGPFNADPLDDRSSSDAVDRQVQRLTAAVIGCVNVDRSLGGNVLPIARPPRMVLSLPFVRRESAGRGRWLLYQGAELRWTVTNLVQVDGF